MSVAGIDFGNFTSKICVARGGQFDIIDNETSKRETPSVVSFGEKERQIGESGAIARMRNLKNTVCNAKLLLGKNWDNTIAQREIANQTVECVRADDGGIEFQVRYRGEQRRFRPEQIVGMLLTKLNATVADKTGAKIGELVISVPGDATVATRTALYNSCQIAGINCLRVVHENTAAAVTWGIHRSKELPEDKPINVMLVNCGEASVSCSVVAFKKGKLEVLAQSADSTVGGRSFDQLLLDHFTADFKTRFGLDINTNLRARERVRAACQKMKHVLSANAEAPIAVECLMNDVDVKGMIKRDDFETMIREAGLLDRIKAVTTDVMEKAGVEPGTLHAVELLGGANRVPCVKECIRSVSGSELSFTLNGSEGVAEGCAILAAILSPKFRVRPFEAPDCVPFPIEVSYRDIAAEDGQAGSSTYGNPMQLFPPFHPIPSTKMMTFVRQQGMEISASYSTPPPGATQPEDSVIGTFVVPKIPPTANGEKPKVKVRMRLDLHGALVCESATMYQTVQEEVQEEVEEEVEVPEQGEAAPQTEGETKASQDDEQEARHEGDGSTPMDTESTGSVKMVKKKIKKMVPKMKSVTRKTALSVEARMAFGLSQAAVAAYHEEEGRMDADDRLAVETAAMRNDLEAYVLGLRGKINGGELNDFTTDSVRERLTPELNKLEDWLYDEGEDLTKSAYAEKLNALKAEGEPIEARRREAEQRPAASAALQQTVEQWLTWAADASDPKYSHIGAEDRATLQAQCADTAQWLEEANKKVAATPKHEDPPVKVAEMGEKQAALQKAGEKIQKTPKPKPKKEEKKVDKTDKQEGDMKKDPNTTQEKGDAEGAELQQDAPVEQPPAEGEKMDVD